jgi:hypothetical protein
MNQPMRRAIPAWIAMLLGVALPLSLLSAQPPDKDKKEPEKLPVPAPVGNRVSILLKDRHGHATPERVGNTHTGAGNTDVAQPRDDTVIVTMTGVAVAGPHPCKASAASMDFDFNQCFEIVFADEKLKRARLTMEATVIGLLRGDKHGGSAGVSHGAAAVTVGAVSPVAVAIEGHAVAGCDNLAINDHKGPISVPVQAGEHHLVQSFHINAEHARGICGKAASAEFAPDPALDPVWISFTEPFHGANKKDFGFRVILRVEPD